MASSLTITATRSWLTSSFSFSGKKRSTAPFPRTWSAPGEGRRCCTRILAVPRPDPQLSDGFGRMAAMVSYQLVIDCAAPERMARFWADALRYTVEPPPGGFDTWRDYWRSLGVPE
ncbi:VOC family protein, partial [Streptosporangium canum]|uniref:VOC family protein n=1 Tax=Streptosporangium canum TaxID=324952 RepID=UPI003424EACA